jgi:hypothetical protein
MNSLKLNLQLVYTLNKKIINKETIIIMFKILLHHVLLEQVMEDCKLFIFIYNFFFL